MSLLRLMTKLRTAARKAGVLRPLSRVMSLRSRRYEARFGGAMLSAIRPGDCVWDVGANLGLYTAQFADRVGSAGMVVAFEPVPSVFAELERRVGARANVQLRNEALGSEDASVSIALDHDPLGATHTLVSSTGRESTNISLRRGDSVALGDGVRAPEVLKIDVEGFEDDVVAGLGYVLGHPRCREVFIEVHFAVLESKGAPDAPHEITSTLRRLGYSVKWLDPSHVRATRG